jgi:L-fuculose-phosphate aldolase
MGGATDSDPGAGRRAELSRFGRKVVARGLAAGPGGNLSARVGGLVFASPSGYPLDEIADDEWVEVDLATGEPGPGPRPTSEIAMHLGVYRVREDVRAVVHTHPPVAIGVTAAGIAEIPFMFPDQVAIVGRVPCLGYIVPCSSELADAVAEAFRDPAVNGLLLRNHGLVTVGANLREAYARTEVMEDAARVYWIAASLGRPLTLGEEDVRRVANLEAEKYRQHLLRGQVGA